MQKVKALLTTLLTALRDAYRAEPIRGNALIVNLAIVVAAHFDVVIDPENVWQVLGVVGSITGIAELTRRKVTPTATLTND